MSPTALDSSAVAWSGGQTPIRKAESRALEKGKSCLGQKKRSGNAGWFTRGKMPSRAGKRAFLSLETENAHQAESVQTNLLNPLFPPLVPWASPGPFPTLYCPLLQLFSFVLRHLHNLLFFVSVTYKLSGLTSSYEAPMPCKNSDIK